MNTRHFILFALALSALGYFALSNRTRAAARLLPFQGRLTDAQGNLIADGPRVIQFKIYDAPVGGRAVWNGEVQKLTVNGGLVSTLLGTKANLSGVSFDRDLYLELTIDANNDALITLADPPLLPRQSIVPAIFAFEAALAQDSHKLAGYDWGALLVDGTNDPVRGKISGAKIQDGSILTSQIADGAVTAAKIAPSSIFSNQIAAGQIASFHLVDRSVTGIQVASNAIGFVELASRTSGTNVPVGGVAVSEPTERPWTSPNPVNELAVPRLSVRIRTTGRRPAIAFLTSGDPAHASSIEAGRNDVNAHLFVVLQRNGETIGQMKYIDYGGGGLATAPSTFMFFDIPPEGIHEYQIRGSSVPGGTGLQFINVRLVVFEL